MPHRDIAVAIHIQTNVLITRPFLITPQFIIGWSAGSQDPHGAHFRIGRNEPTGGDDQPFYIVLTFEPRNSVHLAHALRTFRGDHSAGAARNAG
jgi:hypothetical protein